MFARPQRCSTCASVPHARHTRRKRLIARSEEPDRRSGCQPVDQPTPMSLRPLAQRTPAPLRHLTSMTSCPNAPFERTGLSRSPRPRSTPVGKIYSRPTGRRSAAKSGSVNSCCFSDEQEHRIARTSVPRTPNREAGPPRTEEPVIDDLELTPAALWDQPRPAAVQAQPSASVNGVSTSCRHFGSRQSRGAACPLVLGFRTRSSAAQLMGCRRSRRSRVDRPPWRPGRDRLLRRRPGGRAKPDFGRAGRLYRGTRKAGRFS